MDEDLSPNFNLDGFSTFPDETGLPQFMSDIAPFSDPGFFMDQSGFGSTMMGFNEHGSFASFYQSPFFSTMGSSALTASSTNAWHTTPDVTEPSTTSEPME